jgi:hypothetical protein
MLQSLLSKVTNIGSAPIGLVCSVYDSFPVENENLSHQVLGRDLAFVLVPVIYRLL